MGVYKCFVDVLVIVGGLVWCWVVCFGGGDDVLWIVVCELDGGCG